MLPITENEVEKACLDLLGMRGWYAVRVLCGQFLTLDKKRRVSGPPRGTPDYICSHPLYPAFFLEAKRPGGKLEFSQKFQIEAIEQGYHIPCVVVDHWEALRDWLDRFEEE